MSNFKVMIQPKYTYLIYDVDSHDDAEAVAWDLFDDGAVDFDEDDPHLVTVIRLQGDDEEADDDDQ